MKRLENGLPFAVAAQVVKDRRCQNDVEVGVRQVDLSDVPLNGSETASRRLTYSRRSSVEHGLAEIHECDIQIWQRLQQFETVVARPATHIEHVACMGSRRRRSLGDQSHR